MTLFGENFPDSPENPQTVNHPSSVLPEQLVQNLSHCAVTVCFHVCFPPTDLRFPKGQGLRNSLCVLSPGPLLTVQPQSMLAEQKWILFPVTSRVFCKVTNQDH